MTDRQPSEAIPATLDPRAEAERLLEEAEQPHRDAHDGNWDVSCSACVAELALETQAKSLVRALLAALTAKDEELRSFREERAAIESGARGQFAHDCEAWAMEGIGCGHCNPVAQESRHWRHSLINRAEKAEAELRSLREATKP